MAAVEAPRRVGILHVAALAALALLTAHFTAPFGIGATALAVLLGVIVGNVAPPGPLLRPGVRWASKRLLTAAVVLLGLRVTAADVAALGWQTAALAVAVVAAAPVFALLLARPFGVPRPLAACIGAGTGVCGVAAIAAVERAVGARREDVAYAVAAITLFGSIGLVAYPAVQLAWHPLPTTSYGVLSGATLHSVPQAVGAAFAGGGLAAGAAATVVKLARVAAIGPVAVGLGLAFSRGDRGAWRRLPVEVWGFLALFALGSLTALPGAILDVVAFVDELLLVAALVALGLLTRFAELRAAGLRPLVLALVVWGLVLALAVVALV